METKPIPAIYEAGKLRPLEPLNLQEHELVEVAVVRIGEVVEASEDEYVPEITEEADFTITLEQVQSALAKIPGSLAEDFARERDERF
jgi:predicted DNA-binding antitoxin AbrB/MazE fold protein